MRKNKIPLDKVQAAFNAAIKRRDGRCMVQDYEPCCGALECSHFYTVGGSPSLRFYPPNAYAQCQKHHWNHHNKKDLFYMKWLANEHWPDFQNMLGFKNCYIRYTDELKAQIIRLCNEDKLEELKGLLEAEFRK